MRGVAAALLVAVVAVAANDCPSDWTQDKLLVHEDCNKYYMCTYGEPVEMPCWGDLFFNVQTGQCDWQANVDCGDRNIPGEEPTSTTTPAPETEPSTAEPETEPTTAEPETEPTTAKATDECPLDWSQDKLLVHEDCNKFYMCTYGELVEMTCWGDLYFNIETGQCDWQGNVDCGDRNIPGENDTTTTTAAPETEPSTAEPETEPTTAEPETEPTTAEPETEPTTAEPTTAEPTTPEPTTAEPTTTEPSTPQPGFLENGCPVDPHTHWLLPVEGDCNGFYYCVWGELVLRACPPTLHFNRNIQVCDWPANAGCTTSANKHDIGQYSQRF